jgi:hypothetical protein
VPESLKRRALALAAALAGILVLSHAVVEAADLRFMQPAADESIQTLDAFRAADLRVDVALLGSSRVRRAFTVPVLERELSRSLGRPVTAFNLGLQAGNVVAAYVVARDLLAEERRPAMIVLGLGARSMSSNSPRYHRTIRHLLAPGDLLGPLGPRLTSATELGAVPLVAIRAPSTLLLSWRELFENERHAAILARGGSVYEPDPTASGVELPVGEAQLGTLRRAAGGRAHLAALSERGAKRAALARQSLLVGFEPAGRATVALDRLAALSRDRGVQLLVVNLPVDRSYATAAYERGEYGIYLEHVRAWCARESLSFVDANDGQFVPEPFLFEDGDHLSRVGATLFSRIMARDVLAPRLADAP